jgi:C4-dicarboxylate-specific signal transduction histidine kinase
MVTQLIRRSIAHKLAIAAVVIITVPLAIAVTLISRQSFSSLSLTERQNQTETALKVATELDRFITDNRYTVELLSRNPTIATFLTTPKDERDTTLTTATHAILNDFQQVNPDYQLAYLIDADGYMVAIPGDPSALGKNYQFREYFRDAMQGRTYVSTLLLGATTGRPGIYFAAPVLGENQSMLGVAVLKVNGEAVWRMVSNSKRALLIDREGIVIAHPDRRLLYHSLTPLPPQVEAQILRERYGRTDLDTLDCPTLAEAVIGAEQPGHVRYDCPLLGPAAIAGFVPLNTQPWVVAVTKTERDFRQPLFLNVRYSFLVGLGVSLGMAMLTLVVIRRGVRPLVELAQSVSNFKRGNYHLHHAPVNRSDEIGILARALVTMSEQVQQAFEELESNNHILEERVQERTADLQNTLTTLKATQAQLVQTEKMAGFDRLAGGLAHEINNPANFIYGNLKHLDRYTQDLLEIVRAYQVRYPHTDAALAQLLSDCDLDFMEEDVPQVLQSMRHGVERIRAMVSAFRTFTRLDEAACKAVDLHECLDSTLTVLHAQLHSRPGRSPIEVVKHYTLTQPVECFAGQLSQAFLSLLLNAIDAFDREGWQEWAQAEPDTATPSAPSSATPSATPSAAPTITPAITPSMIANGEAAMPRATDPAGAAAIEHPSSSPTASSSPTEVTVATTSPLLPRSPQERDRIEISTLALNKDWVRVIIADNGPGIPEAIQSQMFDPFFTTKPIGKGSGLGLTTAYQIVVPHHGGKITCQSRVGRGAAFIIDIPSHQGLSQPSSHPGHHPGDAEG